MKKNGTGSEVAQELEDVLGPWEPAEDVLKKTLEVAVGLNCNKRSRKDVEAGRRCNSCEWCYVLIDADKIIEEVLGEAV